MYEDWPLIEASFAMQYGIRLRYEDDMSWGEFITLLGGLMPETPLGQIIAIRKENDREILKHFTPEQHRIRNEWRSRQMQKRKYFNKEEAAKQIEALQQMFKSAFGKKHD